MRKVLGAAGSGTGGATASVAGMSAGTAGAMGVGANRHCHSQAGRSFRCKERSATMRNAEIRLCGAGLFLSMSLAGCGDINAYEQHPDPSITHPISDTGPIGGDSGATKVSRPEGGTNAPTDAMPERDPAHADSGRVPASPMDAGDRKLDAGMSAQAGSDASEAGAPMPGAEDAAAREPMSAPKLPPVSSVTMDGPFTTTVDASAGPGRAGLVVRPMVLGANGLKHPIFIWGPGRGTQVRDYETFMRRIASHGFVVYSEISQAADGTEMLAAITWLMGENKPPQAHTIRSSMRTKSGWADTHTDPIAQ
jgi:hypothetical protein